jgi:hypothetical protein
MYRVIMTWNPNADLDGREHDQDADRHVDEEDPVPADHLGQNAAEDQPDGSSGGADEAERADGFGLLSWLAEQGHDHAQAHRGHHRPADALGEPGRDQHRGADR